MNLLPVTRSDADAFHTALASIKTASQYVAIARADLVLAGCGTFKTTADHAALDRISGQLTRMHAKLTKRFVSVCAVSAL